MKAQSSTKMFRQPFTLYVELEMKKLRLKGFPGGVVLKNLLVNAGDTALSISGEIPHAVEQLLLYVTIIEPVL